MKEIHMRQFSIPTFTPDGFGGALAARQRDVVADAHSTIVILAEASRRMSPAPAKDYGDAYDDGLVHDHGWARSSH
jgi:hypothetical protein